jgi:peptidoglycan/LPS O-acetylase OafA/YrhL
MMVNRHGCPVATQSLHELFIEDQNMEAKLGTEISIPMLAPSKSGNRFVMVDSLRGIAALWVVFYHAYEGHHMTRLAEYLPTFVVTVIANGDLGVAIFFVLSGFVIAHSVSRQTVDVRFMGRFILRRSVRLDIPYWFSMLLVYCFLVNVT